MAAAQAQFRDNPKAALVGYHENGFHVEFDVWTPWECDELIAAASAHREALREDYSPIIQVHRTDATILSAMRNPAIVRVIEMLVKGTASGLQTEFFFGCPGTQGYAKHQDNFFVQAPNEAFASAWSPLVDVSRENGCLFVFPGTHLEPIFPVQPLKGGSGSNQDPNAYNEETIVPDKYSSVDLIVARGSVVYLHSHIVHGSYANQSDGFRQALLCTYIRQGQPFRPGTHARRAEVSLYDTEL